MALAPIIYVCSLFMIGRNAISLAFKIKEIASPEGRKERTETKADLFVTIALFLTAILGIISGIGLLIPGQIFGHYLYFIVSGMMLYSYLTYAGICFDRKNWIMFVVSIVVSILIVVLAGLFAVYMVRGYII
ncbi:MAG: hypothetical protein FK734_09465 [Asgard group archaeon]|nr:hypothetical protein [Asgard group archaeon]